MQEARRHARHGARLRAEATPFLGLEKNPRNLAQVVAFPRAEAHTQLMNNATTTTARPARHLTTLVETASVCGVTTRSIPTCVYCELHLTSNEYDFETNGWYSAHMDCVHETSAALGRFEVVTQQGEQEPRVRYFTTRRRATEVAARTRRDNRREWACGANLSINLRERLAG